MVTGADWESAVKSWTQQTTHSLAQHSQTPPAQQYEDEGVPFVLLLHAVSAYLLAGTCFVRRKAVHPAASPPRVQWRGGAAQTWLVSLYVYRSHPCSLAGPSAACMRSCKDAVLAATAARVGERQVE